MTGRFIAVVGPSGVGKDTVMEALIARDKRLVRARRVITRPRADGGEIFESVSEAEFRARHKAEAFALSWRAHGLCYAIPVNVDVELAMGRTVLANVSRAVLAQAKIRFDRVEVINLHAPGHVLAQRLAHRARENDTQITERLERRATPVPEDLHTHEIDNGGPLSQTVDTLMRLLDPETASCGY